MIEWVVSSSALIVLIIVIRGLYRNRLAMRVRYALWLVVAVRLLLPVSFAESGLSVQNLFELPFFRGYDQGRTGQESREMAPGNLLGSSKDGEGRPESDGLRGELTDRAQTGDPAVDIPAALSADKTHGNENTLNYIPESTYRFDREDEMPDGQKSGAEEPSLQRGRIPEHPFFRHVWLAGVILSGGILSAMNRNYRRRLRISRRKYGTQEGSALPVYVSAVAATPCMLGLFHPAIYLSEEAAGNRNALRYVLCHENTHYRHRDNLWVLVRAICICLHWYNPLVWLAAALSEQDSELACDERAMELLGDGERIRYGRALLDLSAGGGVLPEIWKLSTAMSGQKKRLKERLLAVVAQPRRHAGALAAVMALTALCMTVTFTGRVNGQNLTNGDSRMDTEGILSESGTGTDGEEQKDIADVGADRPADEAPNGSPAQGHYTQSSSIIPVDLKKDGKFALKVVGQTLAGSGEYRIERIELNRLEGRTEATLQVIKPEAVRVLYTRSQKDIRDGDGQTWSYATEEEPLYAKSLYTVEDVPAHETGRFLSDGNGQILSRFAAGELVAQDLNFDGYEDFYLQSDIGGNNIPYYCYLWDEDEGRFEPTCMIPNLEVDRERELLRSATDDGQGVRSVKYYRFDEAGTLHLVRYTEENSSPGALFPSLDLTYCETGYALPAVDEWDYGTEYGGALTERFVYWAKQALAELYDWSGTRIDTACFSVNSFGIFSFGNTPADVKASRIYYYRGYGTKAGFEDCIEHMEVSTERVVWFSPVVQWKVPENLKQMTDAQVAEWYFERSVLTQGETPESVEEPWPDNYYLRTESGKYYQLFLNSATREVSGIYGPYDGYPNS